MKKAALFLTVACAIAGASMEARAWIYPLVMLPGGGAPQDAANAYLQQYLARFQSQRKMAKSFADASAFSSHVATLRGFQDYKTFAIGVGTMAAAQVPSRDLSYYKKIHDKVLQQGDLKLGVAWNSWSATVGGNLTFITDGLYLSAKFGKLSYTYNEYHFDGMNAGGMLNYLVLKSKSAAGILVWRGLSLGSGLTYQYNNTKVALKSKGMQWGGINFKPTFTIAAKTESYVIPLEVSTAVSLGPRFFNINIHAGAGVDFAESKSKLTYSGWGDITYGGILGQYTVTGWQKGRGSQYKWKFFCGPGIAIGPVFIDVPFSYYFMNGFNAGVTLGVAI